MKRIHNTDNPEHQDLILDRVGESWDGGEYERTIVGGVGGAGQSRRQPTEEGRLRCQRYEPHFKSFQTRRLTWILCQC